MNRQQVEEKKVMSGDQSVKKGAKKKPLKTKKEKKQDKREKKNKKNELLET